jgi:hypothetical protein
MRAFRMSIAGLMALVLFLAVGLAAFRSGTETWFRSLYTATIGVLLLSILAARFSRGILSAFWFGFAVVGWSYLLLGFGLQPGEGRNAYEELDEEVSINHFLITTTLIKKASIAHKQYAAIYEVGRYGYDIPIGHLIATVILAVVGGAIACFLGVPCSITTGGQTPSEPPVRQRLVSRGGMTWAMVLSGVLILISSPILARTHAPYFPDMAFEDDKKIDAFLNDEYGRHLEAMGEPSLWRLSHKDKKVEAYRFLRLHPKQHPICVRVEKTGDSVNLRLVVLDGVWVDSPGLIAVDKSLSLTKSQWDELVRRAEQCGLWALGKDDRASVEHTDNNRVLVEGLKGGHYHAVARWTGRFEDIICKDMVEFMLDLVATVIDVKSPIPDRVR